MTNTKRPNISRKKKSILGLITVVILAVGFWWLGPFVGGGSLAQLNSEFAGSEDLVKWQRLEFEGWESKWETLGINPENGALTIIPKSSAWFEDFQGGYLYQEISGNFIVSTRLKVTGKQGEFPKGQFSLAGLLVRKPYTFTPGNWEPKQENWLFFSTGTAYFADRPAFEIKTTYQSKSTLKIFDAPGGWVELRIARVGEVFYLFYRPDQGEWVHLDEFIRPDLPETLQIGLTAYADWDSVDDFYGNPLKYNTEAIEGGNPDVIANFDFVRFSRPGFGREAIATLSPDRLKALTE